MTCLKNRYYGLNWAKLTYLAIWFWLASLLFLPELSLFAIYIIEDKMYTRLKNIFLFISH